jgi:hypothetical protein
MAARSRLRIERRVREGGRGAMSAFDSDDSESGIMCVPELVV